LDFICGLTNRICYRLPVTHAGEVVVFGLRLGRMTCTECGREAILADAVKNSEGKFERVFVCPSGHKNVESAEGKDSQAELYYERQVNGPKEFEKDELAGTAEQVPGRAGGEGRCIIPTCAGTAGFSSGSCGLS